MRIVVIGPIGRGAGAGAVGIPGRGGAVPGSGGGGSSGTNDNPIQVPVVSNDRANLDNGERVPHVGRMPFTSEETDTPITSCEAGRTRAIEGIEKPDQFRAGDGRRVLADRAADRGAGTTRINARFLRRRTRGKASQGPDGAFRPRILPDERVSDAAVLSRVSRENPDTAWIVCHPPGVPSFLVPLRSPADCAQEQARSYYESESLRGGWSVRELDRQIASRAYERLRGKGTSSISRVDRPPADYEIRDPFVLEFLNLKDEYSESDLENALIRELERFLLELGNDFTFVARQRRLRVGTEWNRVDLLLFHRRLRCLVVIDLKIGEFPHADAGQMNLYLNYAREHWTLAEESPPVGLILCSEQDNAVAHYALEGLRNTVLAREYRLAGLSQICGVQNQR